MFSINKVARLSSAGLKAQIPILGELFVFQRNASSYEHHQKYGKGGRNSFNGNVVTVFGGTGFLGRYVINRLAKCGTQIIVPYRGSEDDFKHIRVMGDLGQIIFMRFSINDYESIAKTMTHSNSVVNLIGRNFPTRNFSLKDCLVGAAESIAKAATESGVKQLVHVSSLSAGGDSPSQFMQEKALSERAVTSAFPTATIMRPAECYGDEDRYLNKYAYLRNVPFGVPLVGSGWETTKRPVFIADVAQGVVNAALDDTHVGKLYELYGPEEYYLHDIVDYTFRTIRRPWRAIPVPMMLYQLVGRLGELTIFNPKITRDMVTRQFLSENVTDDAHTFEDLGISPVSINDAGLPILRRHRDYYHYDQMRTDDDYCKPITAYQ